MIKTSDRPTPIDVGRDDGLIAAIADWQWAADAGGQIDFLSLEFAGCTGVARESFLGSRLVELVQGSADSIECREQRAAIAANQPFRDLACKMIRADGGTIWAELAGTPIFEGGDFRGYRGLGRIVTARVEGVLAGERYRQLFEVASDWFWELDAEGRLTYVSSNIEAVIGLPISAYLGKRLAETDGISIDPAAGRKNLTAFRARQPYRNFVYARSLPNGRMVWISSSGAPFYAKDGIFLGYRGIARDVTVPVEQERTLRESEEQFRKVLEAAADYYWEYDADYRITYLSSGFEKLFGVPVANILGKRLIDTPGFSVEPEMGKMVLATQKAKQPFRDFVFSGRRHDGRKGWIKTSGAPIFDASGAFVGYRGVASEISAHVEADAAARLAQRQLHDTIAHVSQAFVIYDAADRIVVYNSAFLDLHRSADGKFDGQLAGWQDVSFGEIAHWQVETGFYVTQRSEKAIDLETLLTRYQTEQAHSYRLRDGRWMLVAYRSLPGGGKVAVWTDITEVKQVERALHQTRRHLEQAQRVAAIGSVYRDLATGAEEWSEQTYRLFGLDRASFERTDENAIALIHPEDRSRIKAVLDRAYAGLLTPPAEYRIVRADGALRVIYAEFDFEHDEAGKPMHLLAVYKDVTELREAERREQEQRRHAQKLESLGTLAGGVAHDLNNTLVPIIALTKMVAKRLPQDSREHANVVTIGQAGARARDLVQQILAYSRKDAPTRSIVDLAEVAREALGLLRASVPRTIQIIETLTAVPPLLGDSGALHQVITNLVTNAAHAIGEQVGTITVEIANAQADGVVEGQRATEPVIRLSICDSGCGMDAATVARIFEPFFTTKAVGIGTGLGLSMVQGIVAQHGGRITVASKPGQGTRFDIFLPAFVAEMAPARPESEPVA
jgi:PAS domain S-box-containing protein